MKTETELREYSMKCSVEHHLCNVEELLDEGNSVNDILKMIRNDIRRDILGDNRHGTPQFVVWEPYERLISADLYISIWNMEQSYYQQFLTLLGKQ